MPSKVCKVCMLPKEENADNFYVTKVIDGRPYYRGVCKSCNAEHGPELRLGKDAKFSPRIPDKKPEEYEYTLDDFAAALVRLSRNDMDRLEDITSEDFQKKTNSGKFLKQSAVEFDEVKDSARKQLALQGFTNPLSKTMGEGTYLVVSDSHGKWCKRPMFELLDNLQKRMKFTGIVHIGHMLDDDNDVSYLWKNYSNLTVVAKPEELGAIQQQKIQHKYKFNIVREKVLLGDVSVCNQELISDYVRTALKTLDGQLFEGKTITNMHRQERAARCTSNSLDYIASPGCLCEPHIVKCIKQIDFSAGFQTRMVYSESFSKYRRAEQLNRLWNQGIALVKVTKSGTYMLQTRIHDIAGEKAVAIFDKVYVGSRVEKPENKAFVIADTHVPDMDVHVLAVQKQIAQQFQADQLIDLGDACSFKALNHHVIGRGEIQDYMNEDLLRECGMAHWVLRERASWCQWKSKHLLFANHERFCTDFVKKNPQLGTLLSVQSLLDVDGAGYVMTSHKHPLRIGAFTYVHGDMKLYGEAGRLHDKLAKAFNIGKDEALVFGHVHSAAIRQRAYSVGFGGTMDQMYNETSASYWSQGCALCSELAGKAFVQLIDCVDGRSWYGNTIVSGLSGGHIKFPASTGYRISYKYMGESK
jgi:hypothetical protein